MGDIFHVCSSLCDKAADTEKVRVKVEEEATVDTESSPTLQDIIRNIDTP